MSLSTASRLGSQNNSERPSSSRTCTSACSDCPLHAWIVPSIPRSSLFQCLSLTRTTVPLRASYNSKSLPPCRSLFGARPVHWRKHRTWPQALSLSRSNLYHIPTPFYVLWGTMCPASLSHFGKGLGPRTHPTYPRTRARACSKHLVDNAGNVRAYMQAGTGGTVGIHFMDQQRESYISIGLREGNAPYVVMRHGGAESLAITV